jgi:hypothetical protein
MSQMDDSIAHQSQQDQPDSSSELPLFTLIPPDGQSGSSSQVVIKNDTNNNNDRNNNNGKSKLDGIGKMSDDDGNNNHHKRQALSLNSLQRYQLDNGTESPHHPSSSVHHHHLLLLQQQQMSQQMNHMDKQAAGLIPVPDNSPSLIVLQPSGQGGTTYSPFFNPYATGK